MDREGQLRENCEAVIGWSSAETGMRTVMILIMCGQRIWLRRRKKLIPQSGRM